WFTHNDSCLTFFFVKDDPLSSPLGIAAGKGHTEIVEKLISAGAVINYQNKNGCTPLYMACQNGHKQTVDVLLKNGANVNLTWTLKVLSLPKDRCGLMNIAQSSQSPNTTLTPEFLRANT
ncbi:Ankyrin repeat domain-containing protein 29, partial [Geodia barretti]